MDVVPSGLGPHETLSDQSLKRNFVSGRAEIDYDELVN
jgi:hypothetical protein